MQEAKKITVSSETVLSVILVLGNLLVLMGDVSTGGEISLWVAYIIFIGLSFFGRSAIVPVLLAGLSTLSVIFEVIRNNGLWEEPNELLSKLLGVTAFWIVAFIINSAIRNSANLQEEKSRTLELNRKLEQTAWMQRSLASVNECLLGFTTVPSLSESILSELTKYDGIEAAVLYAYSTHGRLGVAATVGLSKDRLQNSGRLASTGLVEKAISTKEPVIIDQLPEGFFSELESGLGAVTTGWVAIIPIVFDNRTMGALEVCGLVELSSRVREMLLLISENLGRAIDTAINRSRLEELYSEAQHRNEELSQQQEEMKTLNEELEDQSLSLLKAQDQLESQQIELEEINESLAQKKQELEIQKSALEKSNKSLRKSKKETETASRYKSEFLSNMSHELRTPLNSILVLAQMLRDEAVTEEWESAAESLDTIVNSGDDLLVLINDILDLSKIEAGKIDLNIEPADIGDVTENLEATFAHIADEKNIRLEISCPDDRIDLVTDQYRLEQILKNFLSNALKFTDSGVVELNVMFEPNEAGNRVLFAVKDSGIGIPADQLDQIFQAFKQVDGSTARRYGGTGLGLSISTELAGLLGGYIDVVSTEGQGTTFTLVLPQIFTETTSLQARKPITTVSKKIIPVVASTATENFDDRGTIQPGDQVALIVEDQLEQAKSLVKRLRDMDYSCIVCQDGETGIKEAKSYKPSIIVLDLKLPLTSGEKVLYELRESSITSSIPILVYSAYTRPANLNQFRLVAYLVKPATDKVFSKSVTLLQSRATAKHVIMTVGYSAEVRVEIQNSLNRVHYDKIIHLESRKDVLEYISEHDAPHCIVTEFQLPDGSAQTLISDVKSVSEHNSRRRISFVIYSTDGVSEEEEAKLLGHTESIIMRGEKASFRLSDDVNIALKNSSSIRVSRIAPARATSSEILAGKTVLLVDDDMRNVFALKKVIESIGSVVIVAKNGLEALEKLEEHNEVAIVLMDVMMPVMDGLTAIRSIRDQERWQSLPIIALTAKAMPADKKDALAAGANEYLSKPVDVQKLTTLMRDGVAGHDS